MSHQEEAPPGQPAITWRNFLLRALTSGGFLGANEFDVTEALVDEVGVQVCSDIAPHLLDVSAASQFESHADRRRALDELAAVHSRCIVGDGTDGERENAHCALVCGSQAQDIVTSTSDPDGGKRVAARAGIGPGKHRIAQVVADDGLDPVGEVRQEHGVRGLPGGAGWKSLSTGLRMAQSLFTCSHSCGQSKAMGLNSEDP